VYNPLFIYGGTGLGKTHLMHAIGNEVKAKHPQAIICYETCDRFINEFISSIRLDKASQFREKYEKIDLLLLDDVQFLSNKEQTQEAFFHIFNALYERQKQIVISSDTFPKEINGLQLRLKSRMEWGLVADIQIPDLETKMAILSKKSELHKIDLDDDVAYFIASRVLSNIRELEGALIRVGAFASLTNQTVSVDLAKRVLLHLNEKKKDGVHLDTVVKLIAHEFNVSITDIKSKKRQKDIVHVRQVIFYLMKKLSFSSLQAIGGFIGGRDHSTVIHAIERIEALIKSDHIFEQKIKSLENRLQSI
jgi:chromosomal replication initiator protein